MLAGLRLLLVLGLVRLRRRAVVRGAAALVGLRRDRRGRVPRQRDRVDSRRLEDREIEVDVRADRILVPARDEIEILSVGRPGGIRIDSAAVADARQFAGRNFVEREVAPAVDRGQAQREPAPVRRKRLIMDFREFILRDLLRRSAVGADDPEPMGAIRECQHFPIGREDRRIEVALGERGEDSFRPSLRRPNRDLLPAARIGGVGDGPPVRRPGGVVFVDALCARQIARRAVLSRYAEDIAARREQRALAVRRQREIHLLCGVGRANLTLDVGHAWASTQTVVGEQDGNFLEVLARANPADRACLPAGRRWHRRPTPGNRCRNR